MPGSGFGATGCPLLLTFIWGKNDWKMLNKAWRPEAIGWGSPRQLLLQLQQLRTLRRAASEGPGAALGWQPFLGCSKSRWESSAYPWSPGWERCVQVIAADLNPSPGVQCCAVCVLHSSGGSRQSLLVLWDWDHQNCRSGGDTKGKALLCPAATYSCCTVFLLFLFAMSWWLW